MPPLVSFLFLRHHIYTFRLVFKTRFLLDLTPHLDALLTTVCYVCLYLSTTFLLSSATHSPARCWTPAMPFPSPGFGLPFTVCCLDLPCAFSLTHAFTKFSFSAHRGSSSPHTRHTLRSFWTFLFHFSHSLHHAAAFCYTIHTNILLHLPTATFLIHIDILLRTSYTCARGHRLLPKRAFTAQEHRLACLGFCGTVLRGARAPPLTFTVLVQRLFSALALTCARAAPPRAAYWTLNAFAGFTAPATIFSARCTFKHSRLRCTRTLALFCSRAAFPRAPRSAHTPRIACARLSAMTPLPVQVFRTRCGFALCARFAHHHTCCSRRAWTTALLIPFAVPCTFLHAFSPRATGCTTHCQYGLDCHCCARSFCCALPRHNKAHATPLFCPRLLLCASLFHFTATFTHARARCCITSAYTLSPTDHHHYVHFQHWFAGSTCRDFAYLVAYHTLPAARALVFTPFTRYL